MSALHPTIHGTAETVTLTRPAPTARATARRTGSVWDGPPPAAVQLGAAIAAVACGWFATVLAVRGFGWAALPMAVFTIGILVATFLPDALARKARP